MVSTRRRPRVATTSAKRLAARYSTQRLFSLGQTSQASRGAYPRGGERMKQILSTFISCTAFFAVHAFAQGPIAASVDIRAQMIEQAQKERTVVVAGSQTLRLDQNLKGFKKRFPFIAIKGIEASTTKTIDRV